MCSKETLCQSPMDTPSDESDTKILAEDSIGENIESDGIMLADPSPAPPPAASPLTILQMRDENEREAFGRCSCPNPPELQINGPTRPSLVA